MIRPRRGRRVRPRFFLLLLALLAAVQLLRPVPAPTVRFLLPKTFSVPGAPPAFAWPSTGEAALAVVGTGIVGRYGKQSPRPIASVTKMMTALLILRDHPLAAGQGGPTVRITPADVALYRSEAAQDQSVVRVAAGEVLTERQLLEGLLLPSGNNAAAILAAWDAGSRAAFVARMNAEAARLGMTGTHYADVSGFDPQTVSTAVDQLQVAQAAMAIPTFRHIVRMAQATLPVAGRIYNVNALLGRSGIVGVKTGNTSQAGGCYVVAARRDVGGRSRLVIGVVLGQGLGAQQPLPAALRAGHRLIDTPMGAFVARRVLSAGQAAVSIRVPWASPVHARVPDAVALLAWPGLRGRIVFTPARVKGPIAAGTHVGTVSVAFGGQRRTVALVARRSVPPVPLLWRLTRS